MPRKPSARASEVMVQDVVCTTTHAMAVSDMQWAAMDRAALEQCNTLGDLLREAGVAGVPAKGMDPVEELRNVHPLPSYKRIRL